MKVSSFVVDAQNGQPLDGASISIVGTSGQSLGKGVVAGSDGGFELSSSLLDTPGNKIRVSDIGYLSQDLSPVNFPDEIGMSVNPDSLEAVTFVFKKVRKIARANYTVPIILGSIAVLLGSRGLFLKYHK